MPNSASSTNGAITPGDMLPLIGKQPDDATLGMPPETDCPVDKGRFNEFDGEAVAYAAPYFYIVGSHGCSRKGAEFRLSSFMVARMRVDGGGQPWDRMATRAPEDGAMASRRPTGCPITHGEADKVGGFFGKSLDEEENGLNIEGLAIDGNRVLVGLRAPAFGNEAHLVAADLADLFRSRP